MAFDISTMLPMIMSMMGNKGAEQGKENGEAVEANGSSPNNMESILKLFSGLKGGDKSSLFDMIPQNEKTKPIMEMAKLMSAKGQTEQKKAPDVEISKGSSETKPPHFENPFEPIQGFCGNEVNQTLNKLFNKN